MEASNTKIYIRNTASIIMRIRYDFVRYNDSISSNEGYEPAIRNCRGHVRGVDCRSYRSSSEREQFCRKNDAVGQERLFHSFWTDGR